MITNDRQHRLTKSLAERFKAEVDSFDMEGTISRGIDPLIARAQREQLESEYENLQAQIAEYERLKSGEVEIFRASSLEEIPVLLVKARISRGWTQKQLAERLGWKEQQLQRYESELYHSASLRTLIKVSDILGLQLKEVAKITESAVSDRGESQTDPLDWQSYPFSEMYRRNWFDDFSGTLSEAKASSEILLSQLFLASGRTPAFSALHKLNVRAGGRFNYHSLAAWHARALTLAKRQRVTRSFRVERLTAEWFSELSKLSILSDGPLRAKTWLLQTGIRLVFEKHLPQTHLDGAALSLADGQPVIAMTLRYDRLDNFWFVLFHELAHVALHLKEGEEFFDDLDEARDGKESEADSFAQEALLPNEKWRKCLSRFSVQADVVIKEAALFGIHPSIVAGRIRRERGNYLLLSEMIPSNQWKDLLLSNASVEEDLS